MNWQRVFTITRKDIKEVASTGQIIAPMVIIPLVLIGIIPAIAIVSLRFSETGTISLLKAIEKLPPTLMQQLAGYTGNQKAIYFITVYILASFFLIIPIMVSTLISANSFAGEKERKTLEGILYTPITDLELITGKVLASFIPAMAISLLSFFVYSVVVNALAYPVFMTIYFPTFNWWILMLWLVPTVSFLVISLVVLISAKVRGYQEANSIAGAIVLPIVLVTIGQVTGVMYLSAKIILLTGLLFLVADALLLRFITKSFHRDRLIVYIR